jgi:hypothetical protein
VRQDWEFRTPGGGRLFSNAVGDADPQPNGHVTSTWGLLDRQPDGTANTALGLGENTVRVIELDPTDPASVVEVQTLHLFTEASGNDRGWTGYRSVRIPALTGRAVD